MSITPISALTVLHQLSTEISSIPPKSQKSSIIYLRLAENPDQFAEKFWDKVHVKVNPVSPNAKAENVRAIFCKLFEKSTKEIEGLKGEQKAQAMRDFWNCYDYYSINPQNTTQQMSNVSLPKEDIGTEIRTLEVAMKKKKEKLEAANSRDPKLIVSAVVMAIGGIGMFSSWFCTGVLILAGGVLPLASPFCIALPIFCLIFAISIIFCNVFKSKQHNKLVPYNQALVKLTQLKKVECTMEDKKILDGMKKLL